MSEVAIDNDVPVPGNNRVAVASKKKPAPEVEAVRRVRIILEENPEIPPTGQFFSVNDKAYVLVPGEEADVPLEIIEVLDNAIIDMPVMQGDKILGYRKRLRFPYRVIAKDVN